MTDNESTNEASQPTAEPAAEGAGNGAAAPKKHLYWIAGIAATVLAAAALGSAFSVGYVLGRHDGTGPVRVIVEKAKSGGKERKSDKSADDAGESAASDGDEKQPADSAPAGPQSPTPAVPAPPVGRPG